MPTLHWFAGSGLLDDSETAFRFFTPNSKNPKPEKASLKMSNRKTALGWGKLKRSGSYKYIPTTSCLLWELFLHTWAYFLHKLSCFWVLLTLTQIHQPLRRASRSDQPLWTVLSLSWERILPSLTAIIISGLQKLIPDLNTLHVFWWFCSDSSVYRWTGNDGSLEFFYRILCSCRVELKSKCMTHKLQIFREN